MGKRGVGVKMLCCKGELVRNAKWKRVFAAPAHQPVTEMECWQVVRSLDPGSSAARSGMIRVSSCSYSHGQPLPSQSV